mgnify:FL=1|tara:strand:- start:1583 stop:2083 length:501 start_codon:yes stop_codon:yes gene_type:complete
MSCSNYKFKDTCGESIFAPCVYVEQTFPDISSLSSESCTDLDKVIADLYTLVNKSYVDMHTYAKGCLDYSPTTDADIKPVQVLNKLTEEVCKLQPLMGLIDTTVNPNVLKKIPEFDINKLNLCCLVPDPCGATPATLEQLLQIIINKVCLCCDSITCASNPTLFPS